VGARASFVDGRQAHERGHRWNDTDQKGLQ
jgi:hypothetical protein